MMTTSTPRLPSEAEVILAKETSRILASHLPNDGVMQLRILDEASAEATLKLPAQAARLLLRILEEMSRGNAVTLIPVNAELTTQQAADMLNISRPSLIQLLEAGRIRFRCVGTHRRICFEDLMAFKRDVDSKRRATLEQLAAYDEELAI